MRVVMVAGPGAGKGTQATRLAEPRGLLHVSTGHLLRDHVDRGTPLGLRLRPVLDRGELVPDDVVLEMVREALDAAPSQGYVLDGLPRTVAQAEALSEMTARLGCEPDVALHLEVAPAELVRRLLARAAAEGRSDDSEDVIRRRIEVYDEQTRPLLGWYRERGVLVSVAATGSPDEVAQRVAAELARRTAG